MPLGDPLHQEDTLPKNWKQIAARAGPFPKNFGIVKEDYLYRSAIIWPHQVEALKQIGIKHIITLIPGDWLSAFYKSTSIAIHSFPHYQRRELNQQRVKRIVRSIDCLQEPSIICCLKGKTKTGMVAAGYEIMLNNKPNLQAILESISYGNLNVSSMREMLEYKPIFSSHTFQKIQSL